MAKAKKCKHKNIEVHLVHDYIFPKGWDWVEEHEEVNMNDYFIEETQDRIVCKDCGETVY